jgi:hypothetical protein
MGYGVWKIQHKMRGVKNAIRNMEYREWNKEYEENNKK